MYLVGGMMNYVICSCPRSGSSLLAEALRAMGAGKPEEYLNPITQKMLPRADFAQPTPSAYIERIKQENTVGGVFGIKTHYIHLDRFPSALEQFTHFFPDAKYIAITRRNILRQAISATRANQTDAWTWKLSEKKPPRFSYLGILKHIILTTQEIELWEKFYAAHGIRPLRIAYEDLDEDYENTMRKVVSYLGISGDIPPPPLKKQADQLTEQWAQRCVELFRGKGMVGGLLRFLARRR